MRCRFRGRPRSGSRPSITAMRTSGSPTSTEPGWPPASAHSIAGLPTWSELKGIDAAAERLVRAIDRGERVLIVADYDADGATACAVGVLGLRAMGGNVDFLVPNRSEFGYGLTPEIVALAAER